jgi:excisionase family DNA binding protein
MLPPNTSSASLLSALEATIRAQVLAEQQPVEKTLGPRLLTASPAAEYLGRTEGSVRQLIHKKVLPVIRFDRAVRLDVLDLDKLIDDSRM